MPSDDADHAAPRALAELVRSQAVDAELGALIWLLREGHVPALVIGPVGEESVPVVADALEGIVAGAADPSPVRTLRAESLLEAFEILAADPFNLTDDAIRGLGMVVVVRDGRVAAAHY